MRVALDATPLTLSSGGLRRYVEELSRGLAQEFPDDTFTLISDQGFRLSEGGFVPANLRCESGARTILNRRWWLTGAALTTKRNNASLFHGTNFEVPLLRLCPSVMTIHDLSPWKNREWHPLGTRAHRRTPLLLRLRLANVIITPSQAVRREAIAQFKIAEERVFIVPEAAGSQFRRISASSDCSPGCARPFFLFAGTLEPRKNVALLLSAWREVRKQFDVGLVLVGRTRADGPVIEEEAGLELLGEVSDQKLAALYSECAAFVYPSFYEGFGLPVLESMQCGAPVVISRDAALQELAGGAGLVAGSVKEFADAMEALLANRDLAAQQSRKGLDRALQFSWQRTARMTREVYGEAIGRFA